MTDQNVFFFRSAESSNSEIMSESTNWSSISSLPCNPVAPDFLTTNLIDTKQPRRIPRARRSFSLQMDKIQMLKKDWESFCDIQECENVWNKNKIHSCIPIDNLWNYSNWNEWGFDSPNPPGFTWADWLNPVIVYRFSS